MHTTYFFYLISAIFVLGYALIAIEHVIKLNKAAIALLLAVICWGLQLTLSGQPVEDNLLAFAKDFSTLSQILFFILGALIIVETISVHKGFTFVTNSLHFKDKRTLLWVIGFITFFLSAILDNLTTTIVMVSMLHKLIPHKYDRQIVGGAIVIAANAGGAWTPIGDVTTTMLWIGGQITTGPTLKSLFLPSLACMIFAFSCLHFMLKGSLENKHLQNENKEQSEPYGKLLFFLGVGSLVLVPALKVLVGLPPMMGIMLGVSIVWIASDLVHQKHAGRDHLKMRNVFSHIDLSTILFFLGILSAVNALEHAGVLEFTAKWLDQTLHSPTLIVSFLGVISAIIDNVPLVAATMSMYDITQYPADSLFWQLMAYTVGTGGSMIIIGSAAGVVFMGLEKVDFFWYLKRIGSAAFVGYVAGIAVYLIIGR